MAASSCANPALSSTAVLHVDDSPADRYRRRKALEAAGFRVTDAATGEAARSSIAVTSPDIVLLDVRLPDTDGFELTRRIKADAEASGGDIAVVLISAYFTESDFRVQGLECGADAYLIEPITDAELVATLRARARRLEQLKGARENERLLDALFEHVPEGITVAEAPDVKIRRVSRFGVAMVGHPRETLEGVAAPEHPERWSIYQSDGVTPARPEDLPLTRAVASGAVITDEEWIIRHRDGRNISVLCNAGPIIGEDGRISGGVIAWRDITARKEIEDELRRRTEELQRSDSAKNDFLATVVHEIRQPVQAALTALGVMKTRVDRRAGQRARDVVERQLLQIGHIVEDLLDATRIMRGEFALALVPTDLVHVLQKCLETLRATFTERGLQVSVAVPDGQVQIQGDESRLQQVFVNLLGNAARYTPEGGRIEITLQKDAETAVVRVKDTGKGINPEQLWRIFDLFVRDTHDSQGFGIGLAVARRLVEAHHGTIEAESAGAGQGSEFRVTLPLA
jgi:PAS domain S-box-containing protein